MGMSAFGLMILLCLLLSVCIFVKSASILESSGDLWQNWLLNENEEVPSQQSSPLSRRITPKSVFIAPAFDRCSDGYRLDEMGNCVKVVRVDSNLQWKLILERLKVMSAQLGFDKRQSENDNNRDSAEQINRKKPEPDSYVSEDKDNTGPFQLSIPFISKNSSDFGDATSTEKPKETSTTERYTSLQSVVKVTESPFVVQTTTEEFTTLSDTTNTTPSGTTEYSQDVDNTQYDTEPVNTEATTIPTTTDEPIVVSTFNTASHSCPDCTEASIEVTTPPVVRRTPNYSSVVPLKVAAPINKNVRPIPSEGRVTHFKPLSSYTDSRNENVNSTVKNTTKTPTSTFNVNYGDQSANADSSEYFQKLPSNERTKTGCDPTTDPNCAMHYINVLSTNKPFPINRKPSTAFVRFPETQPKSFVRFPAHKVPGDFDDVTYAESNPVLKFWNDRYANNAWWTSTPWNSNKQSQFIRIVPENNSGAYAVGELNYIRSHPHYSTQTEWYRSNK